MTEKAKLCELETNSICEVVLSDEDNSNDGNYNPRDTGEYRNNSRQDKNSWSFNESAVLINYIQSHYEDLQNPKKKKNIWNLLSAELERLGHAHTPKQCCEKWKNLLRTYRTCLEIKSKSGRGPTRFLYFNLIDSFLGKQRHVEDVAKDIEENHIDNAGICEDKSCWTFNESAALIHYINSHYEDLQNPKKKKIFWNLLSEELESLGYSHTSKQCCVKWMNLLRTYKSCKDVKSKSGRGPTRFMYFELIDSLLGNKLNEHGYHPEELTAVPFIKVEEINPVASTSSSKEMEESGDSFERDTNVDDGAVCGQGDKNFWSFNESSALINCVESHFEDMHHPINKKNFWKIISTEFDCLGYNRTGKECCVKWKNLLRTYKTCKDTQSKLGKGPTRFLFYNHLDSFLARKPTNIIVEVPPENPEEFTSDESDNRHSLSTSNCQFVKFETPTVTSVEELTSDESENRDVISSKRNNQEIVLELPETKKTKLTVEEYIELKTKEWEKRRQEKNEERIRRDIRHREKLELLKLKIELQKQILNELKKQNVKHVL